MSTHFTVYKTTNLVNGKIYIGVHITEDPDDGYLGSGSRLVAAVKKYGRAAFKKEVLFDFDNAEDMEAKEREIVSQTFVDDPQTYNLVPGGRQGEAWYQARQEVSPEKWAEWGALGQQRLQSRPDVQLLWQRAGQKLVAGNRATGRLKGRRPWLGRRHTVETRAKIAAADRTGAWNSQYRTAWINKEGQVKKVPLEALPSWAAQGWVQGRVSKAQPAQRPRRVSRPSAKLTWEKVREIRAAYKAGGRQWQLAERFGVSRVAITLIVNNKTWIESAPL